MTRKDTTVGRPHRRKEDKYRIVSDGTVAGTRVYDPKGRQIGFVTRVEILIDANKPFVEMTMQLADVELDIMERVASMAVEKENA